MFLHYLRSNDENFPPQLADKGDIRNLVLTHLPENLLLDCLNLIECCVVL